MPQERQGGLFPTASDLLLQPRLAGLNIWIHAERLQKHRQTKNMSPRERWEMGEDDFKLAVQTADDVSQSMTGDRRTMVNLVPCLEGLCLVMAYSRGSYSAPPGLDEGEVRQIFDIDVAQDL
jgi:hypothetical protein